MPSKVLITKSKLDNLATAVSAKSGASLPLTIAQMQTAVENIPTSTPTLQTKTASYIPTASQQTETISADNGYDGLDSVSITVNAMPSGTAGTPTATKGTVSNHSVSVTPSVTNTQGYISGGTHTGTAVSVSASELVSGTLNITQNDTYDVTNYASAVVNVSGGGSSAWTKVAEKSYTVSTSSTSSTTVETWATGHSEIWASSKWVYVRIRDTAGKRNDYFYGSDQFFYNMSVVNGTSTTNTATSLRITKRYSGNAFSAYSTTDTTGYGVYADTLYSDGRIRIRHRYNSGYSLTIDGTYKVEVYLLDPAGGVPIFE